MAEFLQVVAPLIEEYGITLIVTAALFYEMYSSKKNMSENLEKDHDEMMNKFERIAESIAQIQIELLLITSTLLSSTESGSDEGVPNQQLITLARMQMGDKNMFKFEDLLNAGEANEEGD